ncbi:hypothetical protein [Sodalis sp. RH16]|uniref:hypothetical protein n=1 Tax=unclassified Sodalis (in: enterobacteria) TaxID=2636512 RepID=UPI0039B4F121
MVAQFGQLKGWPRIVDTGCANPFWATAIDSFFMRWYSQPRSPYLFFCSLKTSALHLTFIR